MSKNEMIAVENINVPGWVGNVNAERYGAMRDVLLKVLPAEPPGLTQTEMSATVLPHLPENLWPKGEKSLWWIKTVQLDLEAKRLIIRNTEGRLTRWHRAHSALFRTGYE